MPGDVLRCLGKCARWFPEVVPGAASGIAYRKCSAAAPVVLERQFRTWRDAIKVTPGRVARAPVTVSGLYRGCTESEHRARLTVACFAPCRIFMEFGVCRWMVDSVQIVLFGVACGVGTDAVSQELLTFLHALRDVESDVRSWCRSPLRTLLEAAVAGRCADAAGR